MPGVKRTASTPQPLSAITQAMRRAGRVDIDAFVQSNVWIVDGVGNEIKLRYRYGQRLLATAIRRQERAGRPVRIFNLKSRQIGTTTQVSTRNLSESVLIDNMSVATVAHLEDRAEEILEKAKYAYAKLPPELQLTLSKDSKSAIAFADTHSKNTIVSAKNIEAVRGGTKQRIHLSEWALYRDAEHALYEVSQVCHYKPGTHIIIETTGRRQDSYAHWFWKRCVAGLTPFEAQFLAWQEDPECEWQFADERDRDRKLAEAFEYEPLLRDRMAMFKLSPGHLYWGYRMLRDQAYGDWERFLEDYPCDDEECWRTKGDLWFGAHNVNKLSRIVKEFPYDTFLLDYEHLELGFTNPYALPQPVQSFNPLMHTDKPSLMIYARPEHGRRYLMAADAAGGGPDGDPATIWLLDMYSGEQMAEFSGRVQPHQLAKVMECLSHYYNGAMCAPEVNNMGMEALNALKNTGVPLYIWRILDNNKNELSNKLGWYTGEKSRALMLSLARRVVTEICRGNTATAGCIKSIRLVNEMRAFMENLDTGKPEAAGAGHDDMIIAFAIAWYTSQQETAGAEYDILKVLRPPDPSAADNIIIPVNMPVEQAVALVRRQLRMDEEANPYGLAGNPYGPPPTNPYG